MRRIIRSEGVVPKNNEILDIFFGIKEGELPEKFRGLHEQYTQELKKKGGCSKCRINGVKKRFRQAVLDLM